MSGIPALPGIGEERKTQVRPGGIQVGQFPGFETGEQSVFDALDAVLDGWRRGERSRGTVSDEIQAIAGDGQGRQGANEKR